MSNVITVTDSLKAVGFSSADVERAKYIVGIGTEKTDANLGEFEPLQVEYAAILDRLPKVEVEDAEGNITSKLDEESDAFKDFIKIMRDASYDRLTFSRRFCHTYAKVPAPGTKALMWVNVATLKTEDGEQVKIDPTKWKVYSTNGATVDPRVRLKLEDSDLMSQVIKPLRDKWKGSSRTALSRLRMRVRGGNSRTQDFGARFAKIEKVIRSLYDAAKKEEFDVGTDAALKTALVNVRKALGLGVK